MAIDVLVVDDGYVDRICENMRFELEERNKKFRRKDVRFHESPNGYGAIDKVRERSYDLVILDFQMPGMNGYETAVKLRDIRADIVMVGNSTYWNKDLAEEVGLLDYGVGSCAWIVNHISRILEESKSRSG